MPDPATRQSDDVLELWQLSFYFAIVIAVIVFGLLLYSVIRHRHRNDDLPKQTEGNVPLELVYTVIPFILVGILFAYGLKAQDVNTELVKSPDLRVDVTGYQWNWRFSYPSEGIGIESGRQELGANDETLSTLVLPVNQRVRLSLVASDVNHSFFVPNFLTKRDLIPGIRNEIEVTPKTIGMFPGHCAEFCGLNHAQMNFRVQVVSEADYAAWVGSKQAAQAESTPVEKGSAPT